jgi:hypothetical protein
VSPETRHDEQAWGRRLHIPLQRGPDRALRGAGARAAQSRHRSDAHEPAILAGCRGHDAHRHHDGLPGTNSGRSAWFLGVLVLMVYLIFAMTLYVLPPRAQ